MTRALALLLSLLLAAPGCAVRSASAAPGLRIPGHRAERVPQQITAAYAARLEVGRRVQVVLKNGERFKATFMGAEGESVRVQKVTRIPEEPLVVPLADIASLGLDTGGVSAAKAIVIGAGIGAGIFLTLLGILAASWD